MLKYWCRIRSARKSKKAWSLILSFIIVINIIVAGTFVFASLTWLYWLERQGIIKLVTFQHFFPIAVSILVPLIVIALALDVYGLIKIWKALREFYLEQTALTKPVESDHGSTIAEVIYRIHKEPVEFAAIYDGDGTKLSESTLYNPAHAKIPDPCWEHLHQHPEHDHIMIHNHPSGRGAFSEKDIAAVINGCISTSILIAGNMLYTLEAPTGFWELDSDDIVEEYDDLDKIFEKLAFCRFVRKTGISSGTFVAQNILICQCLARRYGLKFTCEKYRKTQYYRDYLAERRHKKTAR